jgi:aryl-alcohol dehydrogenase-like predicted oxidoreductase
MLETASINGLTVPRMGLGTNRLTDTSANREILTAAADAGIGMIDTAHLYTGGNSEETIGAALSPLPDVPIVATKGGYRSGEGRPDVLRAQLEQSLRSLRADRIPLYYLHRVDPETPFAETLGALREALDAGLVAAVGLSAVTVDQIEEARSVLPVAAVQNEYSLAERAHDAVIDHCEREGIVFVPYFPLRGADGSAVREAAERRGVSPNSIALAWLLQRSPVVFPIPGTLSLAHLRENVAALEIELEPGEVEAVGAAA